MASPADRASPAPLAFDLKARLAGIDQKKLRAYRLERLRRELQKRDCGAALLADPINIRYATGTILALISITSLPGSSTHHCEHWLCNRACGLSYTEVTSVCSCANPTTWTRWHRLSR